jgi:phosphatidylinositol kinase/protein kinase (PI-3  family)
VLIGLVSAMQAYGRELKEAADWCRKYQGSRKDSDLHQAWDLYYHVFKQINKQLPSLTVLELQYVAPALVRAQASLSALDLMRQDMLFVRKDQYLGKCGVRP